MLNLNKARESNAQIPATESSRHDQEFSSLFLNNNCQISKPDKIPESTLKVYQDTQVALSIAKLLNIAQSDVPERLQASTEKCVARDGTVIIYPREVLLERARQATELSDLLKAEVKPVTLCKYDQESKTLTIYDFKLPDTSTIISLKSREAFSKFRDYNAKLDNEFYQLGFFVADQLGVSGSRLDDSLQKSLNDIFCNSKNYQDYCQAIKSLLNDKVDIESIQANLKGPFPVLDELKTQIKWIDDNINLNLHFGDIRISTLDSESQDQIIRKIFLKKWEVVATPTKVQYISIPDNPGNVTAHSHPITLDFIDPDLHIFSRKELAKKLDEIDIREALAKKIQELSSQIDDITDNIHKTAKANPVDKNQFYDFAGADINRLEDDRNSLRRTLGRFEDLFGKINKFGALEALSHEFDPLFSSPAVVESTTDKESAGSRPGINNLGSTRVDFLFHISGASMIVEDLSSGIATTLAISAENFAASKTEKNIRLGDTIFEDQIVQAYFILNGSMSFTENGSIVDTSMLAMGFAVTTPKNATISTEHSVVLEPSKETSKILSLLSRDNGKVAEKLGVKLSYNTVDDKTVVVITFKNSSELRKLSAEQLEDILFNDSASKEVKRFDRFKQWFSKLAKSKQSQIDKDKHRLYDLDALSDLLKYSYYSRDDIYKFMRGLNDSEKAISALSTREDELNLKLRMQLIKESFKY